MLARDARGEAEAAEQLIRSGTWLGPLHGIPVSVKDNIATAGVRTTAGSPILAESVPERDAAAVESLRAAGAVLVAKANMYEFAFGEANARFGPVRNPWNPERSTAGSSSGSVAAVAAGLSYGSLGTDTGGSIRVPAAFCGVVGLKPTPGRVSLDGVVPVSRSLDHVGPIARTVADAAALFAALTGEDCASSLEDGVAGVRLAVPAQQASEAIDPEVASAVDVACAVLADEGAMLVEVELPDLLEAQAALWTIASAEAAEYHRGTLWSRAGDYHPLVRSRLEGGSAVSAIDYIGARSACERLSETVRAALGGVDALLLPVSPVAAYPLGARAVAIDGREEDVSAAVTRYTPLASVTGRPALSLPCGRSADGLPIGFQIVGHPRGEATVLRVGRAYERATPWHREHPPLAVGRGTAA